MHPAQSGDTIVLQQLYELKPNLSARVKHSVRVTDSQCLTGDVMQDGRNLWQPIIPSDQRGSVSKLQRVYLVREKLCCHCLWENKRWVVWSGTVVSSHLDPTSNPSTSSSRPIVTSSEAESAFQGNAIWLIYCWLRACHMAFMEGVV